MEGEGVLARDVVPGRDELGLKAVRQGVGAVVADAPNLVEADPFRAGLRVHDDPVPDVEPLRFLLQHGRRRVQDLPPERAARLGDRLTADAGRPRRPRASPVGGMLGVAGNDLEAVRRDAHGRRRDLRDHRLHALPLLGRPGRDEHVALGIEPQGRPVLGGDARATDAVEHGRRVGHLDEAREADSPVDSLLPQGVALRLERVVVHRLDKLRQALLVGEVLERQSLRRPARVGIVRPQVPAAEIDRVHADRPGRGIDQPLGHRALDRMPDGAVLAHHVLVLKDDRRLRAVVVEHVGAAHQVDDLVGLDAARARIHRIGADAGQVVDLEREDGAVVPDRDPGRQPMIAGMDVGDEALHAVGDELDRSLEQDGEPDGRHFVGVGVHLDPERAADVARDHPDAVLIQPVVRRKDVLDHVRALGVVPHRQLLLPRVPVRENGPGLETHPGMPAEDEGLLDDVIGFGAGRLDIAEVHVAPPGKVVAKAFVDDGGVRIESGLRIGDGGQHLPIDLDELRPVLRLRPALRDDRGHRLALPGRRIQGQRVLRRGLQPLQMGEHPDPGVMDLGELTAGHDRDYPRGRLRRIDPYRPDPGMGMGGAHERDVSRPLALDVVDEGAAALREPRRVRARDGAADVGVGTIQEPAIRNQVGHDASPVRARAISTASTIAW